MKTIESLNQALENARNEYKSKESEFATLSNPQRFRNRNFLRLHRAIANAERAIERFNLDEKRKTIGLNEVELILRKQFGLKTSKAQTTAVKGWHNHTTGYNIYGENKIGFVGHIRDFDKIVDVLSQNWNLTVDRPVTTLRDTRGSITILSRK